MSDFKSIADVPEMLELWDFDKNPEDPKTVSYISHLPYYWKCKLCGYEWSTTPHTRSRTKGKCPACKGTGKRPDTVKDIPFLMEQWDFNKNTVDPATIPISSKKKFFWKCKKCGKEWPTSPQSRYDAKGKCPSCDSNKSVQPGVNDVFTLVPELKKFYDFEKNKNIDIEHQGWSSRERMACKCPDCGREWTTIINSQILKEGDSYRIIGCDHKNRKNRQHIPFVSECQPLMQFWDNEKNSLDPSTTSSASDISAYWKCPDCGYSWSAGIRSRDRSKNNKCPCCQNLKKFVPGINDALTFLPDLRRLYDFKKNVGIDPLSLRIGDQSTYYWWKCPDCGYEWSSTITTRLDRKDGKIIVRQCQNCYYNSPDRLAKVASKNKLMKFWDFEENKKLGLDPNLLSSHSAEDAKWRCKKCGYHWTAKIRSRNGASDGCPNCKDRNTRRIPYSLSHPKLVDLYNMERNMCPLDDITPRQASSRLFYWRCPDCHTDFTAYIATVIRALDDITTICPKCSGTNSSPDESFASKFPEYLEAYADTNTVDPYTVAPYSTISVSWECKKGHIREDSFGRINQAGIECPICRGTKLVKGINTFADYYPQYLPIYSPNNVWKPDEIFYDSRRWLKWICNTCHGEYSAYVKEIVNGKECPFCSEKYPLPGFNTLAVKHPDIAAMWSEKNEISADETLVNGNNAVWTCPVCHGDYNAPIKEVVNGNVDCPYCNDRKLLPGFNSLATRYPDIAVMWSGKNKFSADQILPNTTMAFWTCPTCHGDYPARINKVINGKVECPYCSNRKVLPGFNSLAAKYPDIANMWSTQNKLSADQVLPNVNYALWTCPTCRENYPARIIDVINGVADCPYCSGRKALPGKTSFAALHPDLMEDWDYIANYCLVNPDEILDTYSQKVWWNCKRSSEHKYPLSPADKVFYQKRHRESCPYCKGRRRKKKFF